MIYATLQDMITRFSITELAQLTDIAVPPAEPDAEKINTAISDATALVNSYLSQRYHIATIGCADPDGGDEKIAPPVITRMVCDLARYNLHTNITEEHDAFIRQKAVIKLLQAIAAGEVSIGCPLGDSPAGELSPDNSGPTDWAFSQRVITDRDLAGYP
ncbi:MAG: DUF1320 domain-containing protein [Azoarcus sp.]|jgi:phage gp36-like protein|nr:DUF1320 domain-containing protein [Azoarcus sp.]